MRFKSAVLLGLCIVSLVSGCAPAGGTLSGQTVSSKCLGTTVPVETEVSLYTVHGAATGRSWERQKIDLVIDDGAPATALVLASHAPVGWDVSGVANLRAVIAYGHRAPVIVGAPSGVPVRIVAIEPGVDPDASAPNCGKVTFGNNGSPGPELMQVAEEALGLKITHAQNGMSTKALSEAKFGDSDLERMQAVSGLTDRLPGAERLAMLEKSGDIRRATIADIEDWKTHALPESAYEAETLFPGSTYVVQRPFAVPDGMHGAHSRNFIIPRGIQPPIDMGSHNGYFRMEDGTTCIGSTCRMRSDPSSHSRDRKNRNSEAIDAA